MLIQIHVKPVWSVKALSTCRIPPDSVKQSVTLTGFNFSRPPVQSEGFSSNSDGLHLHVYSIYTVK